MKKKGLFIVFLDETDLKKNLPGIYNKIMKQVDILNKANFDVSPYFISPDSSFLGKISRRLPYELFKSNYNIPHLEQLDFIYVRRTELNYSVYKMLMKIKSTYKCKIIWEIPTYPYDSENKETLKNKIIFQKDRKYRNKLRNVVDRIVTFSSDSDIWNIKTICISNGVDLEKHKAISVNNINEVNMIAVASLNYWHGYDRLIKGLAEYKQSNNKIDNIHLHIVGEGEASVFEHYKKIVKDNSLENNVMLYGNLYGEELDNVYDRCNLAIDALGRHRSGVYYNSSLKGKEYCAKGLPIISGVKTELDHRKDFKYYFRVPAEDSSIKIEDIITFHNEVYSLSQIQVINEIRNFAEDNFEISKTFKPIIDYINEIE